jgi:hypothetical protein
MTNDPKDRDIEALLRAASSNAPPEAPSPFFRSRLAAAIERGRRDAETPAFAFGLAARRMLPALSALGLLLAGASILQTIQTSREREVAVKAALSPERSGELVLLASFLGEAP